MLLNCFLQRLYQFILISNIERPSWLSPSPKTEHYFVKYCANLDKLIIIIALVTLMASVEGFFGDGNGTPLQDSCLENPRTEEPGGLQSMGSITVEYD